jgi:uncharacterized membrane protein
MKCVAALLLTTACTVAVADPKIRYRVTPITDQLTEEGYSLVVTDLNNRGELVGNLFNVAGPSDTIPFVWKRGRMADLRARIPVDAFTYTIDGINDFGEIVGSTSLDFLGPTRGFLLSGDRFIPIEGTPGEHSVDLIDINNRGTVLATSISNPSQFVFSEFLSFRGTDNVFLTKPNGEGRASALNNRGVAVGVGSSPSQAVRYDSNGEAMLLELPEGAVVSSADDINDRGVIAGTARFPPGSRFPAEAFTWKDGDVTLLPPVNSPDFTSSNALSINFFGTVVGLSRKDNFQSVATIWRSGQPFDLNELIVPDDPFLSGAFRLTHAVQINDLGQILAFGNLITFIPGNEPIFFDRYYLLTPVVTK